MSMSRMRSSTRTRPAWSTRCSISSRGNCVPPSSAGPGRAIVARDIPDGSPEDRLISRIFKPLAKHPGTFGFSDDASAVTPPAGHDLVLKTDGLIAGVHFFADDPADGVARKALRVNLSDLAAKGAAPLGFLLAIALPKDFSEDWLAGFTRGLGE